MVPVTLTPLSKKTLDIRQLDKFFFFFSHSHIKVRLGSHDWDSPSVFIRFLVVGSIYKYARNGRELYLNIPLNSYRTLIDILLFVLST